MSDPLKIMDEMDRAYRALETDEVAPFRSWQSLRSAIEAQAEKMAQKDARIERLEAALRSATSGLRKAAMDSPTDEGHYPHYWDSREALNESPTQSIAAVKAEALREAADDLDPVAYECFGPARLRARANRIEREAKEGGDE